MSINSSELRLMEDGPSVYPDSHSEFGEDHVGLLNDNIYKKIERSYSIPGNLQIWSKNPVFYLMVVAMLAGFTGICIFTQWMAYTALMGSITLSIISAWFAAYIWDHYHQDSGVYTKWQILKMCFTSFIILSITSLLIYLLATMSVYRFVGKDPEWTSFPDACRNDTNGNLLVNCIRTGIDVPNPTYSTGPIEFALFMTSKQNAFSVLQELILGHISCRLIKKNSDFIHFRCLSDFWGYPDDLAIKIQCVDSQHSSIWIHSQSRLGRWDYNKNDERVRLIFSYVSLPDDYFGFRNRLYDDEVC